MHIRKMITIDQVKNAPTSRLYYLNDKLAGIEEYVDLKNAIKKELKERKAKRVNHYLKSNEFN